MIKFGKLCMIYYLVLKHDLVEPFTKIRVLIGSEVSWGIGLGFIKKCGNLR